ncbi:chemotaxis protein CheD [Cognatiyoonia sp. IB215446]|uniref:chemotaxis protein CheD n=1 Tax=Cognatiyoonia sp. IB215446 TaxID=3097355 RepID=UPI002A16421B|nr:chemotaxis protein CheD [Cognatiyoonia sp. IB215446]MDX8348593.1 chemotaxis protein CheD [Cognatiyoonia sp. IB215446]
MTVMQNWPSGYATRTVSVIQGEYKVSSDAEVVLSTVLGSCISVCLFDRVTGIGGMNHYLLADGGNEESNNLKYGAHAMELLVNGLLKFGASRANLKAKVFGGSLMSGRFDYIGPRNAQFAIDYLNDENLTLLAQDTGGTSARRVNFHPVTGQARVIQTRSQVEIAPQNPTEKPDNKGRMSNVILF